MTNQTSSLHLLDQTIGAQWPDLSTAEKLAAFESTPFAERISAPSTYEALRLGCAANPQSTALHFLPNADPAEPSITISHAQFFARVTQSANLFTELGVGPQDVVSLLLPLVPQSFFALFGAEAAGIANPVNPLLEPSQLAEILRAANTKVLVVLGPTPGTDIWEKVQKIRDDLPALKAILVVHGAADASRQEVNFDDAVARQPADRLTTNRQIAASEVAAYFHTGGTTGTPKLVRHTHANQVYQAWVVGLMLRSGPGRTLLFGLPLYHVGGALTQGLASLSMGGTLVILSPSGWRNASALKNVWKLVERFKPEVFGGVPTVLAAVLHVPVGDADVSSLRRFSGGGSGIPVAVGKTIEERFRAPVLEVYGMTETSSVHTISYLDRPVRIGSVGHAVPYSKVRIVKIGSDGAFSGDCAVDEIGVVAMAGPGVFSGYLSESHNKGAFIGPNCEPGWVNSGDLGRLDADGYLWITGRAKDLIIRGGHNIDPMAVEEIFYQHHAVALAAVVGQPDAYAGELPVAYVQLKPDTQISASELTTFVRERSPERAAVPVNIFFIEAVPLTGVGKVFKPALRWDAATRVVNDLLADLRKAGTQIDVAVAAHAVHGSLISVKLEAADVAIEEEIHRRLNPLEMRHEVVRE